jgi:hypothetical protein
VLGAGVFVLLWLGLEYALTAAFFGSEHALATTEQRWLWRSVWGVIVYLALMAGFGGALQARRAQAEALKAARAEAALVRAELAAITGKLNPHFLFNTLNSLLMLTRATPARPSMRCCASRRMMRYVLDTPRDAGDRVPLRDELAFVRDYLALESCAWARLRVDWPSIRPPDAGGRAAADAAAAGGERGRPRHRTARGGRHGCSLQAAAAPAAAHPAGARRRRRLHLAATAVKAPGARRGPVGAAPPFRAGLRRPARNCGADRPGRRASPSHPHPLPQD